MSRALQAILLLSAAALLARLVVTGEYLFYVKPGMLPALVAAGLVLAALAVLAGRDAWVEAEAGPDDDHAGHGHGHGHGEPKAALLLAVPLLTVLLIAPAPLGAFSAQRGSAPPPAPAPAGGFAPLPAGDPVEVTVSEFVRRATEGGGPTLAGRTVVMTGFATPNPDGGWWLTRMIIACCAADAYPARIAVRGAEAPPADAWVALTGTWVEGTGSDDGLLIPAVDADAVAPIAQPASPYQR